MSVQSNPFRRTTIMIMFAIGFAAFIALLYGLGTGDPLASGKNGEAHGASNSLVGYKALANLMEKTGATVHYSRTAAGMDAAGLLILTPGMFADADALSEIMQQRAYTGPTMIILPKWQVTKQAMGALDEQLKKGWVHRTGTWAGDLGQNMLEEIVEAEINVSENAKPKSTSVSDVLAPSAIAKSVPRPHSPVTMRGDYVRNIVTDPASGGALIAYVDDGGVYAQLDSLDESQITDEEEIDGSYFPMVIVADADLMNNSGMEDERVARHAASLLRAAATGSDGSITFDLTLNGLGSADNLLSLAFKPPFLSATICLIIAAIAAAWMAFNRFGPPVRDERSIAFGKTALVNNSAGFIRRMQREYLVADPYAELIRKQAIEALGLSPHTDRSETDRRLDELGQVDGNRFTTLMRALGRARNSQETAESAAALYKWKKELIG